MVYCKDCHADVPSGHWRCGNCKRLNTNQRLRQYRQRRKQLQQCRACGRGTDGFSHCKDCRIKLAAAKHTQHFQPLHQCQQCQQRFSKNGRRSVFCASCRPRKYNYSNKNFTCVECLNVFTQQVSTSPKQALPRYCSSVCRGRSQRRRLQFGITSEQWHQLALDQQNVCAICHAPLDLSARSTHVDHNHSDGHIRGLLCQHCNIGLGQFHESSSLLQQAQQYLTRTEKLSGF